MATRRYNASIGQVDGSIIATIIACHISRNIQAVFQTLWLGMTIHIIGMVQPPGIGMPPPMLRAPYSVKPAATKKMTVAAARASHSPLGSEEGASADGKLSLL